ncbi:APC family permease [Candidatus Enterococcus ferrettii]|uniref:Glutamate:GABA antiporter n=1 Tax=Candidatus Enterococcus ferrettii TaxID=2815324 RepID=A0ABV0EJC9_9ENTE|nr:APC family permease [Enterococcus sp. 665A]MBO1338431.1 APC family permease [Enterococcus sp. 665A]
MEQENSTKALGKVDVYLGIICAILFADVIVSNTSLGPSVIAWWLIIGILFFIPNGLVTAELTGTYPDKGGIYGWIKKAFGSKWAARTSWFYWINCALWMPSAFIWVSGALCNTFFPNAGYFVEVLISIVITWVVIWLATRRMSESKWIVNLGGVSKILIFSLVILAGIFYLVNGNASQNVVTAQTMMPTVGDGLVYLPVILYCCCGMEILAANAHEMQNPRKDLPKAVMLVVILTIVFNMFASWSILQVVPVGELDLVTGLNQVLRVAFQADWIVMLSSLVLLFSVSVQIITWSQGGARGASEAAQEGELPAFMGKDSPKTGAPTGALIVTGIVSTVVIVIYGFMASSAADLFFTLLAFSSILFFVPYAIMFPAYMKLKKIDAHADRPFTAPVGPVLAVICEVVLIIGMVLFVWVPGQPFDTAYSLPIIIGLIVTVLIGEYIVNRQIKKNTKQTDMLKEVEYNGENNQ